MEWVKWFYPGLNLKRWLFVFALGVILACLGVTLVFNYQFVGLIEETVFSVMHSTSGEFYQPTVTAVGIVGVVIGIAFMVFGTNRLVKTIITSVLPGANGSLREVLFTQRKLNNGPAVVVIGGGTGLSVLLRGIKQITSNCTAVVTACDDGGSSGRLRKEMGIIPPGDMRNCLVALSDTEPLMERAMQYRFKTESSLEGHNLGNLFIAAMSTMEGDMEKGIAALCEIPARAWSCLASHNQQCAAESCHG